MRLPYIIHPFVRDKACEDVMVSRSLSTPARVLRDHLRRKSRKDGLRKLDWESTLLIAGKILDLGCGNVFAIEEAKIMLAQSPGCRCCSRLRAFTVIVKLSEV